jgi:hypothetical protein
MPGSSSRETCDCVDEIYFHFSCCCQLKLTGPLSSIFFGIKQKGRPEILCCLWKHCLFGIHSASYMQGFEVMADEITVAS